MRDLGAFPGHYTGALAINDRGQILGVLGRTYSSHDTIFVWDNGHAQIVAPRTEWPGPVLGPNGEVVGSLTASDGSQHAFIWEAGQLTDLGRGSAVGVDGRGDVIGNRGSLPTIWRKKP
jgi:probable HAF family extracellular repeat protein